MWWLGFNMSIAVAVGFIALAGVAAQTGVVMLIYLNQAYDAIEVQRAAEARSITRKDLYDAVMEGAVERVRPKMMTVVAIIAGLLPIMWNTGTGSEVMQRHDIVDRTHSRRHSAIYALIKGWGLAREEAAQAGIRRN